MQASKIETTCSWISSAEELLLVGRVHLGQRAGRLVDGLGGLQDLLGGFFGAADHGAEFAIDPGHFLAVEALAVQHRDFALGAVDRVVDQVELDLELLALLDLCAIGFQHRPGFGDFAVDRCSDALSAHHRSVAGGGKRAIWARMARSSFMISRCMGPTSPLGGSRHRSASPRQCFFDTKTFAMNRHGILPDLHSLNF